MIVNGNVSNSSSSYDSSYSANGGRSRSEGYSSRPATRFIPERREGQRAAVQRTCTATASRSMSTPTSSIKIEQRRRGGWDHHRRRRRQRDEVRHGLCPDDRQQRGAAPSQRADALYGGGARRIWQRDDRRRLDAVAVRRSASGTDTIAFNRAGETLELPGLFGPAERDDPDGLGIGENLRRPGVTDAAYVAGHLVLYNNGATVGSFIVGFLLRRQLLQRRCTSATAIRRSPSVRAGRIRSAAIPPPRRTGARDWFQAQPTASRSRPPGPIRCR